MKITENIELLNCDCMEYMRTLPDRAFDLAGGGPPYGGGNDVELNGRGKVGRRFERYKSTTLSVVGSRGTITPPTQTTEKRRTEYRGTPLRRKNTSRNCSGYHEIRLYGERTTSRCHRQDASLCGVNSQFQRASQWRWQNTHGLHSRRTQRFTSVCLKALRKTGVSTRHRSQFRCMLGCLTTMPRTVTRYSTRTLEVVQSVLRATIWVSA